jgi:chemotaxis protein CheD
MAHTLLPTNRPTLEQELRPAKFVNSAIELMVAELLARGAGRARLTAKLFGGANMFEPLVGSAENSVGSRNIRSAREVLAAQGVPLAAADVGGNFGRTVEFDLATGQVRVHVVRGREGNLVF